MDTALEAICGLLDRLGFADVAAARAGELVVVRMPPHWGHEQTVKHALTEAGYAWEAYTEQGGVRIDVAAPAGESEGEPRRRFRVVVTPHPLGDDFYNLELPGLPMARWGHAEPEGPVSRDMAFALINAWHGLRPDEVELVFEYRDPSR